jgi:hypothetical protein
MINKLKSIKIIIYCFVMALCSETKCMDSLSNNFETKIRNGTTNMLSFSQNEIDGSASESMPTHLASLEDSTTSWTAHLLSPAKTVFRSAYETMKFTTHNPQKALIIMVYLAYQVTAVAADCTCYCSMNDGTPSTKVIGMLTSEAECTAICTKQDFPSFFCSQQFP